jgi:hypothetical protein
MIAVTISGQACWLLTCRPGDDAVVKLTTSIPVDIKRGLTGVGSRRPAAISPRYSLDYRAVMQRADFAQLRAASLTAQDEPILAPLWPHAYAVAGGTQTITAGLFVAYTADFATYAINPGSLAGYTYVCPLIFGRFKSPPRLAAVTDGFVVADLSIVEDSPIAYTLAPSAGILPADTTFANAAGYSAPVFPFVADWSSPPQPAYAVVDVDRAAAGDGRQVASSFFPQVPEQIQTADFAGIGASEAAQVLDWWIRRAGNADAHWVATSQSLWHLAANANAGATTLTLTLDTAAPAVGACLALNGAVTEFVRVTAVSGAVITISAALANSWTTGDTRVSPAFLARHTGDALELNYSPAGWVASYRLAWREVAAEFAVPAGETRGTTVGRLPGGAWFFKIDLDYNGVVASTYLTNWESGATGVGGHDWTYNACDFDRLTQSDDLEDDSCTFSMRWYAGCPWENWLPGVLSARGFLTIYRADVDSVGVFSNFAQEWKGELSTPTPDGANISVKVLGANALFARRAPRQVMSLTCGTPFLSSRCGLLLADWTWNAVVVSVSSNSVTIGTISRANGSGNPSGFGAVDWFALGWLGWTAAGLPQREGVLTSAALSGGHIVLTLDRPPSLAPGASVYAAPGCDKQGGTCLNKFANFDNNRGFPFMPAVSPSFIIPQQQQRKAKK